MSTKDKVPDAWDDDWIAKGDESSSATDPAHSEAKLSKAERRARQAELNRKLWEEAEAPSNPYFVETRNDVPFKSEFKPAVKVLSRKPAPKVVARTNGVSGLEQLVIEDDDDEEDEDESKAKSMTMEERKIKAQKEREEKQRKYEEVRERLFGNSNSGSGGTSPGTITPPAMKATGDRGRGRGRGRGGGDSRPSSSTGSSKGRQLYDPNYTPKPDSIYLQKTENQAMDSGHSAPVDEAVIRNPRGPDGSGRGGFGFANRGGRST